MLRELWLDLKDVWRESNRLERVILVPCLLWYVPAYLLRCWLDLGSSGRPR